MTTAPVFLHASLHALAVTHRRRLRLLRLLLFIVMASALIGEMSIALSYRSAGNLLLLGLVALLMLPTVVMMGGLLWYLDHVLSKALDGANALLQSCTPLTGRLKPLGPESRAGTLAELHLPADGNAPARSIYGLINSSFRWNAPPRHEVEVQLYGRDWMPGSDWVALQADGVSLLGKVVDRTAYERRQRILRILILVLLCVVLVAALVFGKAGH